eukprot:767502-Hanusia_phi.AAC.3
MSSPTSSNLSHKSPALTQQRRRSQLDAQDRGKGGGEGGGRWGMQTKEKQEGVPVEQVVVLKPPAPEPVGVSVG